MEMSAFEGKEDGHAMGRSLARLQGLKERGTVAVSENFASLYGVGKGDTLRLPVRNSEIEVRVIGTFTDYTWNRGTVMLDREWFKELFKDRQVDLFDVFLKPGADRVVVEKEIAAKYGQSEAVFTMDRQQVYDGVQDTLTKIYSMAYAQQLVVGVVALLGVVSALYISVLQRKRDLGLLRAVGATRTQVLLSVLAEAVLMGLVGAVVGFFIGLVLEWYALNIMIYDESGFLFPLRVPWVEAGAVSVGSVALATVAGLWPAYLATTLRIPDAIAYE
jgi:putative ABC transport system permease protein